MTIFKFHDTGNHHRYPMAYGFFLLMRDGRLEGVLHVRREGFSFFNQKVFVRFFLAE